MDEEQKANYFGAVLACYLCTPSSDITGCGIMRDAVLHLARQHEVDAFEYALAAGGFAAMSGLKPSDYDARIAELRALR